MIAHFPIWTAFGVVLLLQGCATERRYPPPNLPASARLVEVSSAQPPEPAIRQVSAIDAAGRVSSAPREVLVLSGGGMYGAYPAGVLKGWAASGRRPRFDVVTGISTGALIAPFALLGPEYDATLERGYTSTTAADLYRLRLPPALLWSDSLAKAHPLRQRVRTEITPEILQRIAQAHAEGRRLYVGTTDLDTKRLVVWDLGAIAAGNEPRKLKLFRDVLLASCAIPGLLPPVPIDIEVDGQRRTELHVDGGVSASLFLPPSVLGQGPCDERRPAAVGTNVYVIVAGKLKMESKPVERRFTRVSGESLSTLLQSRTDGDLLRVYTQARRAGAEFGLTAVPDDLAVGSDWMSLDVPALKQVFEAGYQFGSGGGAWRPAPPDLEPRDQSVPRAGVRFTVAQ